VTEQEGVRPDRPIELFIFALVGVSAGAAIRRSVCAPLVLAMLTRA